MDKQRRIISHDIQVGTKDEPLWRHWGHSIELEIDAYTPSDTCDFCKTKPKIFFKTICHCGLPWVREVGNMYLGLNASWSPENGDFSFFSCEQCVDKVEQLVQQQEVDLLNHEILIQVVRILKHDNSF